MIVEDGTGLPNANSYASYAEWLAYWEERGTAPTALQADVEKALVRGADYLSQRYDWRGVRLTSTQALDWPRAYAYREASVDTFCAPIEGVPVEVKQANIELGKRALDGELVPDPELDASGHTLASTRDKLGPLETERVFTGGAPAAFVKRFPAVDQLLRRLVASKGGRVWRA